MRVDGFVAWNVSLDMFQHTGTGQILSDLKLDDMSFAVLADLEFEILWSAEFAM